MFGKVESVDNASFKTSLSKCCGRILTVVIGKFCNEIAVTNNVNSFEAEVEVTSLDYMSNSLLVEKVNIESSECDRMLILL